MTEVNGLRLAYRGFVAGIAGGYVWAAVAMTLAGIAFGDPLRPLRPFADALGSVVTPQFAFVLGLASVQAGGALVGMCFAYFFARFFTVRATLAVAAPATTLLAWALIVAALAGGGFVIDGPASHGVAVAATLAFGAVLAAGVPVRGQVLRRAAA